MKKLPLALCLFSALPLVSTLTLQSALSAPKSRPVTLVGFVSGPPSGGELRLRVNGQVWRVKARQEFLKNVRGGDQVRAFGRPLGLIITNARVRVLRRGASDNPDDFLPTR